MYSVKLDEQNYFTGSYAKVGSIPGGIAVDHLPEDKSKYTCYQWLTKEESVTNMVPVINEAGEHVLNEQGEPTYIKQSFTVSKTDWFLDEKKVAKEEETLELETIRLKREEVFKLIDKYQLPLVYASLTTEQQEELKTYRQAWLDAPETKIIPQAIVWLV